MREERAAQKVDALKQDVADAMGSYSKGRGSLNAVNDANRALADEVARMREISGGRVPDKR